MPSAGEHHLNCHAGENAMKRLTSSIAGWTIFAFAVLGQTVGVLAQPSEYYSGKTVRVIVGLEAGGTVDVFVRAFAAHLKKHIPGNPTIIVQNMPGAGTYAAINFLAERAAPDGLTLVFSNYNPLGQAFGEAALRTRFDRFEFLSGIGMPASITSAPMRSPVASGSRPIS
jgi:tripartite-type tricarboxylate transporter receptor subunit TctC